MTTKNEKILQLTPITTPISDEKVKWIAKRWSHNGLDLLLNIWHKYYNDMAHYCINSLMNRYSEKQLHLEHLEKCIKEICQ